jgi:hypothetical protein
VTVAGEWNASRGTEKHNLRIPPETWDPAEAKAKRLASAGYLGEHGRFSVSDAVRADLRAMNEETDEQTIERLGLKSMLAEAGQ